MAKNAGFGVFCVPWDNIYTTICIIYYILYIYFYGDKLFKFCFLRYYRCRVDFKHKKTAFEKVS